MVVVRILFFILCSLPREPRWWAKAMACARKCQLGAVANGMRLMRRCIESAHRSRDDVELGTLAV